MGEELDYAEFRRQYEARHPASIPRRLAVSPYPAWLYRMTWLMFACSALLSGVHTIPVVHAGIPPETHPYIAGGVALGAFAAVELAILMSSFAMKGGGGLAVRGTLLLATITALTANVYSVIRAFEKAQLMGDYWTLAVAIIIGIVAPGIAFLSGKMLTDMDKAARAANSREEERFKSEAQAWDARIDAAWNAYQARMAAARTASERSRIEGAGRPVANGLPTGREKPTPAEEQVIAFLRKHPEALNWKRTDLANAVGVAKSTAHYGVQWVKARPELLNGSHTPAKEGEPQ